MADRIIRIKNNTGADGTWRGVELIDQEYYTVPPSEFAVWQADEQVFDDVAQGTLVVNNGANIVDDFNEPLAGWNWIIGNTLPMSDLGDKLAVHQSSKPLDSSKEFYLVWTGSGDDITNGIIGEGDLLAFDIKTTDATVSKEIRFDPQFGDVYIHEGYAKWDHSDGSNGAGDHMSAMIMADPTALQTVANLDLVIVDNWVKLAPGGPGTGTHGFAATPTLIPRTLSHDGDWDYDGASLTPNLFGTGGYKISDIERTIHKYINRIPMCFSSNGYDRLTSDETAFLPPGYFIRVTAFNVTGSAWNCAFMFEVYRERTAVP